MKVSVFNEIKQAGNSMREIGKLEIAYRKKTPQKRKARNLARASGEMQNDKCATNN